MIIKKSAKWRVNVMIFHIIQINFVSIVIILFLILFILANHALPRRETYYFLFNATTILTLIIVDCIEFWTASWENDSMLRSVMTALGYSIKPLIAYEISFILRRNQKKHNYLLVFPLFINTIIVFSSCWNGIVFSYSPQNEFVRGTLGCLPFITGGIYLMVLIVSAIKMYRHKSKDEVFIAIVIISMCMSCSVLESIFRFKGFLNAICAMSLTFYYLYLHTQLDSRDALTGVLNRRYLYLDAEKLINSPFAVVSMDLNNLKMINDTLGHSAGDEAICTMVECVRRHACSGCTLYRMGGDEFIMLCAKQSYCNVEKIIEAVQKDMASTPYSCAIGLAYYHVGDDFDKICAEADAMMYVNKWAFKMSEKVNSCRDE